MATNDQLPDRPDWMTDDFLKTVIKNDLKVPSSEFIEVGDVKVQYVVPKGENYTSIILRVTVSGNFGQNCTKKLQNGHANHQNGTGIANGYKDERKYVLKCLHQIEDMKVFVDESRSFDKEVDMLQSTLPAFQTLLDEAGLQLTFAARILHSLPEFDVIVMEDLSEKGYVLGNRFKGADLDECKVLYKKLARLHGASMRYYEQKSLSVMEPYYLKGMMAETDNIEAKKVLDKFFGTEIMSNKVLGLANDVLERPGYEREHELFMNIKDYARKLTYDMYAYKPGNIFNAHLHGDCWLNNMLYKYDEHGKATDVILLDLQLAYYNSVANEFLYNFFSSASNEVRKYHYRDLVEFYFENLIETLELVGYKAKKPTLEQFYEELLRSSSMFIIQLSIILPILKAQLSTEQKDRTKSLAVSVEGIMDISNQNRVNPVYLESLFVTMDMMRREGITEYHEKLFKEYSKKIIT